MSFVDNQDIKNMKDVSAPTPGLLDSVFESAIDGIIVIDSRGIISRINQSACDLFLYPKEELIGKNVNLLVPQPHHQEHNKYIQNYLNTGVKKIIGIGRDVNASKKTGALFPIRLSISEFKIDGEIYFTGVIHDLTAQKETEIKLQNLARNLESLVQARTGQLQESVDQLSATNKNLEDEIEYRKKVEQKLKLREKELVDSLEKERDLGILKSRFVSIASHEFRTPLANILSSISLIQKYNTSETQDKRNIHIEKIKKNIHYLNGVLNEFLTVTRIEEGKFELKLSEFCLAEFLEELIDDSNPIKKTGQTIHISYNQDLDFQIISDQSCLRYIMNNIISNAIKYSPENSKIEIGIQETDIHFIISVSDEGIGIAEEELKFIFDIFFRGTNVLNIPGTGLGLNIVQKYLSAIQGNIRFDRREPKGTKVTINLPKYVRI